MIPVTLQILTNKDCNLRCKYCYEQDKARGKNDIHAIKAYITHCLESVLAGLPHEEAEKKREHSQLTVEFIGGESLLYPDLLDAACSHVMAEADRLAISNAPHLSITSNGTQFGREDVRDFIRRWGRFLYVGLSIDGIRETHDVNRIDTAGKGTYERAVDGFAWLRETLCPQRISVKATYNHATIDRYGEGVINLIRLGFTNIAANVVFEEDWNLEEAPMLRDQILLVADHLIDNNLVESVRVHQLNPLGLDLASFRLPWRREANHCGSCTHMRCLGYDGKVYGCHRFATMDAPLPIGHLDPAGDNIVITKPELIAEVADLHSRWPEDCRTCGIGQLCASCAAIPWEVSRDDPAAFLARKGQCGFTLARVTAILYLKERLEDVTRSNPSPHFSKRDRL